MYVYIIIDTYQGGNPKAFKDYEPAKAYYDSRVSPEDHKWERKEHLATMCMAQRPTGTFVSLSCVSVEG